MKSLHTFIYVGIVLVGFLLISFVVYYNRRKIVEQFDAKVNDLVITDTTSSPEDKRLMLELAKCDDTQNANSEHDKKIDQTHLPKV
jgi:hypothetical protein